MHVHIQGNRDSGGSPARLVLPGLLLAAAVFLAWSGTFRVPFLYDDHGNIVGSGSIRSLWPVWQVLFPPKDSFVGGRPLFNLSFAVNYAISGLSVWSYHVFNVLVHALSALFLFGVARRTFRLPDLAGRFGRDADVLAFFLALIWALHPLHTDAVTYITQRAESMMGMFFLASLYCALRGWEAGRSRNWHFLAILGFVAGVGVKEVIVALPLAALAYEWVFFRRNPVRAVRTSPVLYGGFGLGLVLLALLVGRGGTRTVTPDALATPFSYLATQAQVILHYLRTAFWPSGLCLDYGWPIISFREALPYGAAVAALLGLSILLLARRRPSGFLGAWFFLILAPTSSIMPLPFVAWDRRMYLSLAAVAALVTAGGYVAAVRFRPGPGTRRALVVAGCLLATALGTATWARNLDYRTEVSIWNDVVTKRPDNERAWATLSLALEREGKYREAEEAARRAISLKREDPNAWINLAIALRKQDKLGEAVRSFETAVEVAPDYYPAHYNLAVIRMELGDLKTALAHLEKTIALNPEYGDARLNRAMILIRTGDLEQAEKELRETLPLAPSAKVFFNLGLLTEARGERAEAEQWYAATLEADPENQVARNNLATILARKGQIQQAAALFDIVLQNDPDNVRAHVNLGNALHLMGRDEEARAHYNKALDLDPGNKNAARGLAVLSEKSN